MKEPLFFGTKFNFFSNNLLQSTRLQRVWKETDIFNSHSEKKKKKEVTGKKGKNTMVGDGGGEEIGEEEKW